MTNLGRTLTVTGLSANLTNRTTGTPIPDANITFTDRFNHTILCTATTDASGTATCTAIISGSLLKNLLLEIELALGGYTARFAATLDYTGAAANAPVLL